jgi:NADH-quinone oxidoreductase subunit G
MEGYEGIPPSSLIARFWSPGWNSVQAVNKFQSEIGGPLHGGDPGRRLIELHEADNISYFTEVPSAFSPDPERLLVLPLYHIFGSEELSILSPSVAERVPQPYLGLNPDDMHYLQINDGAEVEIILDEKSLSLPARRIMTLPSGIAGLPIGLPGLNGIVLPARTKRPRVKKSGMTS